MNSTDGTKVLVRRRKGRMVAGVCAGLAEYFGRDVTMVRVLVCGMSVITAGTGVLAYLAAWGIVPREGEKTSIAGDLISKNLRTHQADGTKTGFRPFFNPPPASGSSSRP